jgi:hypothetical protein
LVKAYVSNLNKKEKCHMEFSNLYEFNYISEAYRNEKLNTKLLELS